MKTLFMVLGLLLALDASSHPLDPALLELREAPLRGNKEDGPQMGGSRLNEAFAEEGGTTPGLKTFVEVLFQVPAIGSRNNPLEPVLPEACRSTAPPSVSNNGQRITWRWRLTCEATTLAGQQVAIKGLEERQTDVLVRVEMRDGKRSQTVLRADQAAWTIPDPSRQPGVLLSYSRLGVEHILGGFDHLLFVLGLLFLVRDARALFFTVTAFTIGHSITLTLAVLGWINLPSSPIEILIAVSIWVLAVRLADNDTKGGSMGMALIFGWLHGLGFAGALAEAGLPSGDIPRALFAFNLGIEVGQVAFVLLCLGLAAIVGHWRGDRLRDVIRFWQLPAAYLIGILASYWIFERAFVWLIG